jgi:AraC family transcriptional regulator
MALRQTTRADYKHRLLQAQRWLETHLDEPIDSAAISQAAHFSVHHFHRIFSAQIGESVMQYVRRLRLERAARVLRLGEARLIDVALQAGYDSHEAFTRAFAAHFGVPPSVFRDQTDVTGAAWQRAEPAVPAVPVHVSVYPAIQAAFMRQRGSYAKVGLLWQRLLQWAESRGLLSSRFALYGLCPDDPEVTPEALLRFDACITVPPDFAPDGTVSLTEIPSGTYAVGIHRGPYTRLNETYIDVIGRWLPDSGHEAAPEAVVEHYLNDPGTTAPADLRTEVRVRLAD